MDGLEIGSSGSIGPTDLLHVTGSANITNNLAIGNDLTISNDLTVNGDLQVNGGEASITAGAAANASLALRADQGTNPGDEWQLLANNADKLIIGNDKAVAGTYASVLTLTGNATATDTTAEFAGDVTLKGSDLTITSPDATAIINIESHLGDANGDSWKITGSNARTLTFSCHLFGWVK